MSTVKSIETYFSIRGISDKVNLQQDSQDVDSLADYVSRDTLAEYGSFFVYADNGEILNIWGISAYTPRDASLVDLIYSAAAEHKRIARQNRKRTHWIGLAGLRGYIPQCCDVYASKRAAINSLMQTHDLSENSKYARELSKYGYTDLILHKHGNEYAEVTECDCDDPATHSDTGDSPFDD